LLPLVQAGEARPLLTTNAERSSHLPKVPTARELGFDAVAMGWQGICVAKGTPQAIVDAMDRALKSTLVSDEVRAKLQTFGAERPPGGPGEFAAFIRAENALWRPLIRDLGLRMES
jgi:tripartite-type tricarboxylate transporter receptor subunit TctC